MRQLRVLSAGALGGILPGLAEKFGHEPNGCLVEPVFGTVGKIRDRLLAGESADVVILSRKVMEEMVERGLVFGNRVSNLASTGMGVLVRKGAIRPDISGFEAFTQTLLGARKFAWTDPKEGGTGGIHLEKVLRQLGILEKIQSKSTLSPDGATTCKVVAEGDGFVGVSMISEIMNEPGVDLVGRIPGDLQLVTHYQVGLATKTTDASVARAFIRSLKNGDFAAAGLDYKE